MAAVALRYAGSGWGDTAWFWQWHGPVVALLAICALFDDELAQELRELAWRVAPWLAAIAALAYPWFLSSAGPLANSVYLGLLLLASVAFWRRQKEVLQLQCALATLGANLLAYAQHAYFALDQSGAGDALPWLAGGTAAVAVAFLISLLKMGLWPWLQGSMVRLNLALGGPPQAPAGS
jgi:hypothetical protein